MNYALSEAAFRTFICTIKDRIMNNVQVELNGYAKKSDITRVYRYKGSVADENELNALPNESLDIGDVYNITSSSTYGGAGMNVVYIGYGWDALGAGVEIATLTNNEINAICNEY